MRKKTKQPKQLCKPMTVSMPVEIKEKLEQKAAEKHLNLSSYVRMILAEHL